MNALQVQVVLQVLRTWTLQVPDAGDGTPRISLDTRRGPGVVHAHQRLEVLGWTPGLAVI